MLSFPIRITQGVTVKCLGISMSDYPASSWDLVYIFVIEDEQTEVNAVADGDNFDLTLTPAVTAEMNVGQQYWQAFVSDGTDRYKVGEGSTEVVTDFQTQTAGFDGRSELRKQVDAMWSVIAGTATNEQKKVKFADREIDKYDRSELIQIYNTMLQELRRQDNAIKATNGQSFGGRVRVRM